MRYLASAAALASMMILVALSFSSCTCHKQIESDGAPAGFRVEVGPTVTAPPRVEETPVAATPTVQKTVAAQASPTVPAALPSDFPSDVPVIPGSTLAQVQDMANKARNVIFTSEKSVPELVKTYDETMRKAGWRVTQQFTRDQHAFATYEKGDMLVNVTIIVDVEAPGQQMIAVMYEEQQPLPFDEDPAMDGDE